MSIPYVSSRRSLVLVAILLTAVVSVHTQTSVTLQPKTAPAAGQSGVHNIAISGSGFPAGTIQPVDVTVSLQRADGTGPVVETKAASVKALTGTLRQLTFRIPAGIDVTAPTDNNVRLRGNTTTGTAFLSTNASALTVNPQASIVSLAPASIAPGQSGTVTITANFTDFVNLSTMASFGAGISVGGAADGAFGPVTVTSRTTATANIAVSASAPDGVHTVTVRTGVQEATAQNLFSVVAPNTAPVARPGGPYSGIQGQQITFDGSASSDPDAGDSIAS
jgi:hypothetical protein